MFTGRLWRVLAIQERASRYYTCLETFNMLQII